MQIFAFGQQSGTALYSPWPLAFCTVFPLKKFTHSSEELFAKLLSKELAGFATRATFAAHVKNLNHMLQFQLEKSNQENKKLQ